MSTAGTGKSSSSTALFCALMWIQFSAFATAETPTGVVYPQIREPYRSVFNAIVDGVRREIPYPVREFQIAEDTGQSAALSLWAAEHRIKTLVSLGSKGLEQCADLPDDVRLVFGAVLTPSQAADRCSIYGGISLAPAPGRLFEQLKRLTPAVSEVSAVYSAAHNQWLIERAAKAAQAHGLRFHAVPAETLSQAAQIYRKLIESGLGAGQAVWLLQDPVTVDQNTILPVLLKASWDQGFVVFSSNAAHVKRGVLFALYPDYRALGTSLGRMAKEASRLPAENVKDPVIQPLTDVLVAVNLRTADHLKLNLTNRQIEAFDLTFPAAR